ncbi:hypothetical protein KSP40_PGU004819 [Platanthera guangdongensis]|uniref:Uncharacterized protein n=1 Tax=Platanthera guangdongensis TaxID=2320717 RepID=A0ABR2M196_9ASPA
MASRAEERVTEKRKKGGVSVIGEISGKMNVESSPQPHGLCKATERVLIHFWRDQKFVGTCGYLEEGLPRGRCTRALGRQRNKRDFHSHDRFRVIFGANATGRRLTKQKFISVCSVCTLSKEETTPPPPHHSVLTPTALSPPPVRKLHLDPLSPPTTAKPNETLVLSYLSSNFLHSYKGLELEVTSNKRFALFSFPGQTLFWFSFQIQGIITLYFIFPIFLCKILKYLEYSVISFVSRTIPHHGYVPLHILK